LVQHASWRWAFLINLPLATAVVGISFWRIPESRSAIAGRVDWLAAILATFGLGGLVSGFLESVNRGWRDPLVVSSLLLGLACLIAFGFIEKRAASPMVPLELFASRSFTGANLLTLLLYAAIGIFFFLFPLNLIQVQGYSSTATGAALLPLILLMFILSRWSGGLVTRYGPRVPLVIGPLIAGLGFLLFARPTIGGNYWSTFFPAVLVLGFGMAITVAPLTTVVMNSVDENRVGTASGINNAVARVAGVLAIAVLGIVMVNGFAARLNRSLAHLSLPSEILQQIRASQNKLGGMQVPDAVDPGIKGAITASIREAFVFAFRVVLLICAALSVSSAAIAWIMIPAVTRAPPG
jgi:MFS family permease